MISKNIDLADYFNSISGDYNVNVFASFFVTNYIRRQLVNKIKSYEDKTVLDLMSGRGENIKHIKKYNNRTSITTVDFSKCMNQIAKENLKNRNVLQVEKNFFNSNLPLESYDIILCSFGIKTLKCNETIIFSEKMSSLLKPNGEVLLLEMVKPKNVYFSKFLHWYLEKFLSTFYGNKFKILFPFIENHKDMNFLKKELTKSNFSIIEYKRVFDLFEIIHARKTT
ncbi:class I SAM-dependent methyltransferase [Gaetbulibacter jejuensis]|uniref:class I SAM-dependent methyltransferase n=1 Tax=Gaetbulibacter jejuensis TaxID=584607 RepID=UPI00300B415F